MGDTVSEADAALGESSGLVCGCRAVSRCAPDGPPLGHHRRLGDVRVTHQSVSMMSHALGLPFGTSVGSGVADPPAR
jgi:hypothetical protein